MDDNGLRAQVLTRADADPELSEHARLVVLAALAAPEELADAIGGGPGSAQLQESLAQAPVEDAEPVGAFLRSITVQGFRGIGQSVTLPLRGMPGLVVVAGRNGSGKSTLAEGLELALTGVNSRWKGKAVVWSQQWRNLHAGDPASIQIALAEEGSGPTTIGVDWPAGDVAVGDHKRWVQRHGAKREDPSTLGWHTALEMYRPLLSYDELSGILEGKPSDFYEELHKLLGLEALTLAMARLDGEVKQLKIPATEAKRAKDALKPKLEAHHDARAATALVQAKKTKPDLDAVRPLIIGGSTTAPAAWMRACELTTPTAGDVEAGCAALREAADHESQQRRSVDALTTDRNRLLQASVDFHSEHGDQPCPVCTTGHLDNEWATAARELLERGQATTQAQNAARAATEQARSAVTALVRRVPAPPSADPDLTHLAAATAAHRAFVTLPPDGDHALAQHITNTLGALTTAYDALRTEAGALINARDNDWEPIALDLADWVRKAEAAAETAPQLAVATQALQWLQDNAEELRDLRIAPLAEQAKAIWAALRQESNVGLGGIRLLGSKTQRRVKLEADVDGTGTDAFGVMSQGELQALALAIFIPRATSPASPFRFLVLDDPIQAMDPTKIDGFLQVLIKLATDRQVIVFTHDDRLPAAIRRSQAPAVIVEVSRSANSQVNVQESSNPAKRLLDDAFAIAADNGVPLEIKKVAIPVLCRDALEGTAWDVYAARELAAGQSRADVEATWEKAKLTKSRVGLAISSTDDGAFSKWLSGGSARRTAMSVATNAIHNGTVDFKDAVNSTRTAIRDLAGGGR